MPEPIAYCAYQNWTDGAYPGSRRWPGRIHVHKRDCCHCKKDRCDTNDSGPNDAWHSLGEFASPEQAMQAAMQRFPTAPMHNYCGTCLRHVAQFQKGGAAGT